MHGKYVIPVIIAILSVFLACVSCKSKKIMTVVPPTPSPVSKPIVVSSGTVVQAATPKVLTSMSSSEKTGEVQERAVLREHPFVPLLGGGVAQQEIVVREETQLPDTIKLSALELKGIIRDKDGYSGLFKNIQTGKVYLTRQGKLLDRRSKPMKDIVVAKVAADKVLLKRNNQQQEYVLKKGEK